jgi:hypothetical protein
VTTFQVGGTFGTFSWTGIYDDAGAGKATLQASGPGRALAIIRQADGRQAAVYFNRPGDGGRLSLPAGADIATSVDVVINGGPVVIQPARLNPFDADPTKPGSVGGFEATTSWVRV